MKLAKANFEQVARDTRADMMKLTPGERIRRAVELAEFGNRLAAATKVKRPARR